jgi:hypothetical protein
LIYDWNKQGSDALIKRTKPIQFDDETLRDGLQSPSAINPSIAQKIELLALHGKTRHRPG